MRDTSAIEQNLYRRVGTLLLASAISIPVLKLLHLSVPFFDAPDATAGFDWTLAEVQQLHLAMSDTMQREVDLLAALASPTPALVAA